MRFDTMGTIFAVSALNNYVVCQMATVNGKLMIQDFGFPETFLGVALAQLANGWIKHRKSNFIDKRMT